MSSSPLLSPCDSCTTLPLIDDFNTSIFQTYLSSRIADLVQHQKTDQDITLIYNHQEIVIRICSVLNVINSFIDSDSVRLSLSDLTVTHLLIYLYQGQSHIFGTRFYIDQISLIHLGKGYKFENKTSPYLHTLNIQQFNSFLVCINSDSTIGSQPTPSIYQFFNLKNYVNDHVVVNGVKVKIDTNSQPVTYMDGFINKIKSKNGRQSSVVSNTSTLTSNSVNSQTIVSKVESQSSKLSRSDTKVGLDTGKDADDFKRPPRQLRRSLKRFFFNS
ncbi:hypothetical protein G9P44_005454 [Scheffersomyces stipitis]|nr:hypothetical protein G9P44_005454 [Scheffersomyces stipitis]